MRLIVPTLLAIALLAPSAHAATITDPGAQVFTLGGNGTLAPKDGAPASTARFSAAAVGALPDGSVAMLVNGSLASTLWRIDPQGRLHRTAAVTRAGRPLLLGDLAVFTAGGGVEAYAASSATPTLLEVSPTGAVRTLARLERQGTLSIAPDGSTLAVQDRKVVRVTAAGRVSTVLDVKTGAYVQTADQLADGTIAYSRFSDARLFVRRPDGRTTTQAGVGVYNGARSLVRADGSLVLAGGDPDAALLHPGSTTAAFSLSPPTTDEGDGAAPGHASIDAAGLAETAEGALVVADAPGVRELLPPGVAAPVASLTAAGIPTFATTGQVTVSARFAGTGRLEVLDGSRTVASTSAPVAVGDGTITLPAAPPAGELTLRLTVTSPDGRTFARSTRAVVTLTTLSLPRARTAAATATGSDGDEQSSGGNRLGKSRRISPTRVDFQDIQFEDSYGEDGKDVSHTSTCIGRISVRIEQGAIDVKVLKGGCDLPSTGRR